MIMNEFLLDAVRLYSTAKLYWDMLRAVLFSKQAWTIIFFETNALVDAEIAPSVTVLSQMNIKTHPHVNAQVYSTSKTTCLDCIKCTSCLPYDGHLSIRDHVTGKTAPMQYEEFLDLLQKQTSDIPYTLINSSLLISRRPQIML